MIFFLIKIKNGPDFPNGFHQIRNWPVVTAWELFVKTNLLLRPFALVTNLSLILENFFVKTRFVVTLFSLILLNLSI